MTLSLPTRFRRAGFRAENDRLRVQALNGGPRPIKQQGLLNLIVYTEPEHWPTTDELPEADVSDLVQASQYQSTVDADFES